MDDTYTIVAAQAEHLAALPAIERAAEAVFAREDLPARLCDDGTPGHEFRAAQREGRLWVAVGPDGAPVGFALIDMHDDSVHLEEMDVHPAHGRRGIGAALVREVASWARRHGYASVTLTTFVHLPWNAPFYRRLGFRIVPSVELTAQLADILADEARRGFDPGKRVAMRCDLSGHGAAV